MGIQAKLKPTDNCNLEKILSKSQIKWLKGSLQSSTSKIKYIFFMKEGL